MQERDGGLLFRVQVQPRASKNQAAGLLGDALKLRLCAPPVEGAANKACVEFFAKALGLSKSGVEITAGHSSRKKTILARPSDKNSLPAVKATLAALAEGRG
ncbi:MAG: DUF167 domain-containing protein [Pseudomonadota bacterium]